MIDTYLIPFLIVSAVLTITPGADTMLVIRNTIRGGLRDGIVTTFGICTGLYVHAILSALGLSIILTNSVFVFNTVKLIGASYLCWLGIKSLINAGRNRGTSNSNGLSM